LNFWAGRFFLAPWFEDAVYEERDAPVIASRNAPLTKAPE